MPSRRAWTKVDVSLLKQIYRNNSNQRIAFRLGRTESSVQSKAARLGLRKSKKYMKHLHTFGW
jgi:hypothetical protein